MSSRNGGGEHGEAFRLSALRDALRARKGCGLNTRAENPRNPSQAKPEQSRGKRAPRIFENPVSAPLFRFSRVPAPVRTGNPSTAPPLHIAREGSNPARVPASPLPPVFCQSKPALVTGCARGKREENHRACVTVQTPKKSAVVNRNPNNGTKNPDKHITKGVRKNSILTRQQPSWNMCSVEQ